MCPARERVRREQERRRRNRYFGLGANRRGSRRSRTGCFADGPVQIPSQLSRPHLSEHREPGAESFRLPIASNSFFPMLRKGRAEDPAHRDFETLFVACDRRGRVCLQRVQTFRRRLSIRYGQTRPFVESFSHAETVEIVVRSADKRRSGHRIARRRGADTAAQPVKR